MILWENFKSLKVYNNFVFSWFCLIFLVFMSFLSVFLNWFLEILKVVLIFFGEDLLFKVMNFLLFFKYVKIICVLFFNILKEWGFNDKFKVLLIFLKLIICVFSICFKWGLL